MCRNGADAARRSLWLGREDRRHRRLRHRRQRQPSVAVGHPGPVRRLLRCRRQGDLRQVLPRRGHPRRRRRHRAAAAVGLRGCRLRRVVGAQGPCFARGGRQHRQRGPDLPTVRHPAGVVGRLGDQRSRRPGRKGRRQLGLGQRVRAPRRRRECRPRPVDRLRAGAAVIRHAGVAQGRDRRFAGDDLQRVRPGPGGREPGHR